MHHRSSRHATIFPLLFVRLFGCYLNLGYRGDHLRQLLPYIHPRLHEGAEDFLADDPVRINEVGQGKAVDLVELGQIEAVGSGGFLGRRDDGVGHVAFFEKLIELRALLVQVDREDADRGGDLELVGECLELGGITAAVGAPVDPEVQECDVIALGPHRLGLPRHIGHGERGGGAALDEGRGQRLAIDGLDARPRQADDHPDVIGLEDVGAEDRVIGELDRSGVGWRLQKKKTEEGNAAADSARACDSLTEVELLYGACIHAT